jgi:hypothetical protein
VPAETRATDWRVTAVPKSVAGRRFAWALAVAVCLLWNPPDLHAQGVEVTPFGGARFGGDFFDPETGRTVDVDSAPAFGVVLDVPWSDEGLQIEGLFSRQDRVGSTTRGPFGVPARLHITIDHYLAGALQEYDIKRPAVRPFLTGMLGLTRYAADADSEVRFTIAAGGGVKLFPARHVGARLETRLYTSFVDAGGSSVFCAPGICFLGLNVNVVWQAEFTAGLVVKFQ